MTPQDQTAAILQGYDYLIKFKDGEELFLKFTENDVDDRDDEDELIDWLVSIEKHLDGDKNHDTFPISHMAINRDTVKYIRLLKY